MCEGLASTVCTSHEVRTNVLEKKRSDLLESRLRLFGRCLKPGGYLEHAEFSPGSQPNVPGSEPGPGEKGNWGKEGMEAGRITGRPFDVMYHMHDWMREAGFTDLTERRYQWPLGTWPKDKKLKELGFWSRAHVDAGLENWSMALLTRVFGWSYEEVQVHIAKARVR